LAFVASFLPLGQIAFPAVADEPATTIVEIPGQTLALMVQQTIQAPYRVTIEGCLLFAGFWGRRCCWPLLAWRCWCAASLCGRGYGYSVCS
jgi:hypothetical protein